MKLFVKKHFILILRNDLCLVLKTLSEQKGSFQCDFSYGEFLKITNEKV